MTSDQAKTLAFLARRVGALEKKVDTLEQTNKLLSDALLGEINRQDVFQDWIEKHGPLITGTVANQEHFKTAVAEIISNTRMCLDATNSVVI
jgi:hypothetical protein